MILELQQKPAIYNSFHMPRMYFSKTLKQQQNQQQQKIDPINLIATCQLANMEGDLEREDLLGSHFFNLQTCIVFQKDQGQNNQNILSNI